MANLRGVCETPGVLQIRNGIEFSCEFVEQRNAPIREDIVSLNHHNQEGLIASEFFDKGRIERVSGSPLAEQRLRGEIKLQVEQLDRQKNRDEDKEVYVCDLPALVEHVKDRWGYDLKDEDMPTIRSL